MSAPGRVRASGERIKELVGPSLGEFGCQLWGLEIDAGRHRSLLRLYIDAPAQAPAQQDAPAQESLPAESPPQGIQQHQTQPGSGVTLDMCEEVCRHVQVLLGGEGVLDPDVQLEISSPGVDRRFFQPAQLRGYEGRDIWAKPHGQPAVVGSLCALEGDTLVLRVQGQEQRHRWPDLQQVRLSFPAPKPLPGRSPAQRGGQRAAQRRQRRG